MQKLAKLVTLFALIALLAAPLAADDKEKKKKKGKRKGRGVAAQLMKKLEKAELSEEQTAKVKEIVGSYSEKIAAAQKEVGTILTPELRKKRAEAGKKARADGKKGKELQAAISAALGLSEEQQKAYKVAQTKATGLVRELNQAVAKELTEEQRKAAGIKVGKKKPKKKSKKKKKKDDA